MAMFLTAVILIAVFSLSDLGKWLDQNGATDKDKLIVVGIILLVIFVIGEYSCAVTPQVRQTGNRLSGLAGTAYASLLA